MLVVPFKMFCFCPHFGAVGTYLALMGIGIETYEAGIARPASHSDICTVRYWVLLFRNRSGSGIGIHFIPVLEWLEAGQSGI
jgi:hypothetical protein